MGVRPEKIEDVGGGFRAHSTSAAPAYGHPSVGGVTSLKGGSCSSVMRRTWSWICRVVIVCSRAAGLPVVVVPDDGTAADILEAVGEHEQTDSPEPSDLGTWPRLADLWRSGLGLWASRPSFWMRR